MNLKTTIIIILNFFSVSSFVLSYRDSIGVENLSGKKVIIYKLEPKDNYYSIGRKYGISPKIIIDFNKNIALNIGTIIRIPTQINFEESLQVAQSSQNQNLNQPETLHTVVKKETLYSISALYGMKMEDLKKLNKLTSNALSIGKVLKVINTKIPTQNTDVVNDSIKETPPQTPKEIIKDIPKPEPVKVAEEKSTDTTETNDVKEIPRNKYGITELSEKGTAVWIDDKNLDATKSYALHRTAPVGTIIKITNPMSGRSVFAKVVGRYTENETTKDVIVVITRAAAEAIGVIDKRFFVNIGYGIPNNEK